MKKIDLLSGLSKRELVELDACTRCGNCVQWCPVVTAREDQGNTPMEKLRKYREMVQDAHGLRARLFGPRVDEEKLEKFAQELYECTTCGRCGAVCPVGIHCQELWVDVRAIMRRQGYGPQEKIDAARDILEEVHNPFDLPMEERNRWIPEGLEIAEEAELAFFVGCELAYKAKEMPLGAVRLLEASGIPYTLLEEEWCCGFPPYVLGERGRVFRGEVEKNVEGLKAKGVKKVAPYCPCCLAVMRRGWPEVVDVPFQVVHLLEVLSDAVREGRLAFTKPFEARVTYHDPCYLSRGWGDGEELTREPREIIRSIPGVELVEMEHNRKLSLCPGAGGGLRRTNLELSHDMSVPVLKEAEETGAEVLLTACPAVYERFKMTVSEGIYRPKLKVMDILEFAAAQL
ncbi:MAG: (Fe-S)-binding protein [Euryarchaeota archaeon]|nr:(Fe-S)-binding protein [Euryarchaeota archaeon]